SACSKQPLRIPGMSLNWSRNRALKRPRSFLTGCARALPKRGRPSSPRRPDTPHPRMEGGREQALLQRGRILARLRDKARDFAMIRLAVTGPKVRTGGTPRICCEGVADTER